MIEVTEIKTSLNVVGNKLELVLENDEHKLIVTPVTHVLIPSQTEVSILEVGQQGPQGIPGIPGPPGNASPAIYFDFGDASPAILFSTAVDVIIKAITLVVSVPFNGAPSSVSIGTDVSPELLIEDEIIDLSVTAGYEAFPNETITAGTQIKAFITPGLGITQGSCIVFIEYVEA